MGRKGPCRHCGITSSPLWRHGPVRKPVLCNACGSRWRVKGTLAHYTPLHAQAFNHIDIQGSKDTEEVRSDFSNLKIPKRKRGRPSTVEKLRRDLFRILQEQESLCPSQSPEEVLIFKREDPQFSDEIGLGCVLLKPPVPKEEPKSQSIQVSASEGSKGRLTRAIEHVEQWEENRTKWSAFKEKYLERIQLGNSNTLQSMHALQMHKNMKPSNKGSFETEKEITSDSAFVHKSGISMPTDRLSKPPCHQISEVRMVKKMLHSDSCWSKRCRN